MKKLFEISSEEKNRILEMHETATKKNYLSEQPVQQSQQRTVTPTGGIKIGNNTYLLTKVIGTDPQKQRDNLDNFRSYPALATNITAADLERIGLGVTSNGKVRNPGRNESGIQNMEALAFSLINSYLTAIAMKTNDATAICNGSIVINNDIVNAAEADYNSGGKSQTPVQIYQWFRGVPTFHKAVQKAAQYQITKLAPTACQA